MEASLQALHHQVVGLPSSLHPNKASPSLWMAPTRKNPKRATPLHINKAQGKGFGSTNISTKVKKEEKVEEEEKEKEEEDDEIPEEVFNRIMKRIFFFVGTPMASSIGLLYLMEFLKEKGVWDVPMWLPLLTVLIGFGTSGMGIAYGSLSTSWDPDREGSLLGWQEAQKNWPQLWKDEEDKKKNRI
ncbi:hypothetical protein J5N97_024769 [Dioscorea zingiberensis]|uniref:Uncharacterized protein n=1 Tax=Dioscorea zingiberensis TaxID=325984 RepID=A0A9D5C712_9LILI|nr:hypothetical protein J5N97_024769 [Dioscorea zingiberensis]